MVRSLRLAALACGVLSLVPTASAQQHDAAASLFTEDVVVSANLAETRQDEVGASVTVINAAEIAARDQSTALELLRTVPGVTAVRQGGPGRVGSVFLRGGSSSQTLVLVDGVRVNTAGSGAFDFADLPASEIERIEVVRGPQSSLYGSEAMGGVISITTRRGGAGLHAAARLDAGTEGAGRVEVSAEGGDARYDWRVGAGRERQPGYSLAAAEAGDETLNPYRNTHVSARAGARLGAAASGGRVEATLTYVDATAHPDSFGYAGDQYVPVAAPDFTQDRTMLAAGVTLRVPVTRSWNQTVRAGFVDDDLRGDNPDNAWDAYDIRGRNVSAATQADVALGAGHDLTAGASYERRAGENRGAFGYDETASLFGLLLQDRWSWGGRLFVTGAVRYDDHSVFGGKTTWRATGAYRLGAGDGASTRLHASWGTGFKAPTFVDLYFPFYGNRELRPETSEGWDAGVARSFAEGRVTLDATYFSTRYDDLIVADQDFVAANLSAARASGVEARAAWAPSAAFALEASFTYTDAVDRATGARLARRPQEQAALSLYVRPGRRVSALLSWFLYRDRVEYDGSAMDDVSRVDATLDWKLLGDLALRARVQNLFDADDVEVPGYRSPGRLASVGALLTF